MKTLATVSICGLGILLGWGLAPCTLAATLTVTSTADSGAGSLRQALIDAAGSAGSDTIEFDIPYSDPGYDSGLGVWVIKPLSALPEISDGETLLHGQTQSINIGADTNPYGPEIEIDGSQAGAVSGLKVTSEENVIRGLVIKRFEQFGIIIQGTGAYWNTVAGNYIGTDPTGTVAKGNGFSGLIVYTGPQITLIGGFTDEDRNVISGNGWSGIELQGHGAEIAGVFGNYIGTDRTGTTALGNDDHGIYVWSRSKHHEIGGDTPASRNLISGNGRAGIMMSGAEGDGSSIRGNFIGTDVGGTSALPNMTYGISLSGADNFVGGPDPGEGNLISGNNWQGIYLVNGTGNTVAGNLIGVDVHGNSPLPNGRGGIEAMNGEVSSVLGPGNVIAHNGLFGLRISGAGTTGNTVTRNSIHGNEGLGIENTDGGNDELEPPILGYVSPWLVTGLAIPNSIVEVFSDGLGQGKVYEGSTTAAASGYFHYSGSLDGPHITATATDAAGNTSQFSIPAPLDAYTVTNTMDSGLGSLRRAMQAADDSSGAQTVLFHIPPSDPGYDAAAGVWTIRPRSALPKLTTPGTSIDGTTQASFLGIDPNPHGLEIQLDGSEAGSCSGLHILSSGNEVRGLAINRFEQFGVLLEQAGAYENVIAGNHIGLDPNGSLDPGNGFSGILLYTGAHDNIIGGAAPEDRNVVSGNGRSGVEIQNPGAEGNLVIGNFIGTDSSGQQSLGNGKRGVHVWSGADGNRIGGADDGQGNVISGNGWSGIELAAATTTANVIQGNYIGLGSDGSTPVPNGHSGISVAADFNIVGGFETGELNVISANEESGITVAACQGNEIRGNIIGLNAHSGEARGNGGDGISILSGAVDTRIERNDIRFNEGHGCRVDGAASLRNTITQTSFAYNGGSGISLENGGNLELPAPVITGMSDTQVQGTAPANSTVEIFSAVLDEGFIYEGTTLADASGAFTWSGSSTGSWATATATDSDGNTSEFSLPATSGILPGDPGAAPATFGLEAAEPNPFRARTSIRFALTEPAWAEFSVFDVAGRRVCVIMPARQLAPGAYEASWDGRDSAGRKAPAGVYYCRLRAGGQFSSRTVTLLR